jgi:hypothetical protein
MMMMQIWSIANLLSNVACIWLDLSLSPKRFMENPSCQFIKHWVQCVQCWTCCKMKLWCALNKISIFLCARKDIDIFVMWSRHTLSPQVELWYFTFLWGRIGTLRFNGLFSNIRMLKTLIYPRYIHKWILQFLGNTNNMPI